MKQLCFLTIICVLFGLSTIQAQEKDLKADTALYQLEEIEIKEKSDAQFGIERLKMVEGTAIYAAKKNEVIIPDQLTANLATNNSRQIYAKVPGLNIWESDGAGLQLGIGGRGLSPNRSSNFNSRQNGYDISADALGYPESYYTPPVEALQRIEIVRGAAALQYGTQFGGMLNFCFKEGPEDKKIQAVLRQTIGSFGLFNSFNSLGGTIGKGKLQYYSFYQYKKREGWRANSSFDQHVAYTGLKYRPNDRLSLAWEYTFSHYLAQQAGGLTDAEFIADPSQSKRSRNWFQVNWNLASIQMDYRLSAAMRFNSRFFGLIASRDALGNLDPINLIDFGDQRDFLRDQYRNWGNESRLIHRYSLFRLPAVLLVGTRYYQGLTDRRQGLGNEASGPDFYYVNPERLEGSAFALPSRNISLFAEHIFYLSPTLTINPGLRFEYIRTAAMGYYRNTVKDLAGNTLLDEVISEEKLWPRSFVFGGIGLSYKPSEAFELYSNFAQNYRAINFNDIRVTVGSLVVDPNLKDERGFNTDLGIRGNIPGRINFDVSLFHLSYQDRIGTILKKEPNPNFNNLVDRVIRYRTNVADARIFGLESYAEWNLLSLWLEPTSDYQLSLFSNLALIHAHYHNAAENGVEGNQVELVPKLNMKNGLSLKLQDFSLSWQWAYVSEQFSDASNAIRTPTAIEGLIPAYQVMDLSMRYVFKKWKLEAGINNLTDASYFTRRATGYPGPGIIPSDRRNVYLGLEVRLN